ncbi:MAG: transglutaminase family protein, partial [Candidatus Eremiobacterota bacterium]
GEGHLPLACAADPVTAAPVTGSFTYTGDPVKETFHFEMSVTRIREAPRVTLPYSDEQWEAVLQLGDRVDRDLERQDVRLTMGGEPTFVSIDDMDGPEWNVTALGETKRRLAHQLLTRLRQRFAPDGVLHHGQGKLYPGESLPRWALSCYWRADGQPLWRDHRWLADEDRDYGFGPSHARKFLEALARRLGGNAKHVSPGYEDIPYFLWRESRLPVNVEATSSQLEDPEERARLARVFGGEGVGRIVGYSLPLKRQRTHDGALWQTQASVLRRTPMRLIPGDSPMGYRLPLDSLPWVPRQHYPWPAMPDPLQDRPPLPAPEQRSQPAVATRTMHQRQTDEPAPPSVGQPAPGVVRTFLCVEPRNGRLYVFLPPLEETEDYLELLQAVEDTAARLEMPVLLEGYPPPDDPRLRSFSVTPDPGVIEVNLHPSSSWRELVDKTRILYEEARLTRLGTEKFMLDGRHSGTGGGNHLILGGPTPADSPFLRRPDLLRSLVACWNNHPSLSYLFSGLFIGPTSQAPRLDEARHDTLYELEIAFSQVPEKDAPPWLVDRVFRHLLTDASGNTHRAEFCIDKLYSPDSPGGRRGLVEFRSFEMPPHWRMSLAQHVLLRALVAWFWREPYRAPLVRWGTELHDRFMLHHYVRADFEEVLQDLARAGYGLSPEAFEAHFEFRFPRIGSVVLQGVELELRTAIEPWHVTGETPGLGGQVRYVDSSLERVQVRVRGMTDQRHVVTCGGRRVPLTGTGTRGEFVAGVRYRAWQPPHCLHPTIGVHTPLVFDLIDTWSQRSIGGCTYHVAHPGGRAYDRFPVNAYEAESRRAGRFQPIGHTPGEVTIPPLELHPEFPHTLDLRRPH